MKLIMKNLRNRCSVAKKKAELNILMWNRESEMELVEISQQLLIRVAGMIASLFDL